MKIGILVDELRLALKSGQVQVASIRGVGNRTNRFDEGIAQTSGLILASA